MDSLSPTFNLLLLLLLLFRAVSGNMESRIVTPRDRDIIEVNLGSRTEIVCKAVIHEDPKPSIYWIWQDTFVEVNDTLPMFYTEETDSATLTFRQVSEETLAFNYTCVLNGASNRDLATISLRPKRPAPTSSYILVLGLPVAFVVMVTVTVVLYVTLRVDITLFVRDRLCFHNSTSDGKSYDAYMMPYKGPGGAGLSAQDRRLLEAGLEEELGYKLCLYHRDILPGQAVAEAILDCIEQSRRLVLVPCSLDQDQNHGQEPGQNQECGSDVHYGLLLGLHAALVERQTQLVLIQTEPSPSDSHTDQNQEEDPLPEALHLLAQAGHTVTWHGPSSCPLFSSFWKHLRYHLPAKPRKRPLQCRSSTLHPYHPC